MSRLASLARVLDLAAFSYQMIVVVAQRKRVARFLLKASDVVIRLRFAIKLSSPQDVG